MKYLVVLIIIASFLPLQGGMGCSMGEEVAQEESPCHMAMAEQSSGEGDHRNSLKQTQHRSDCYFCQSGACSGAAFIKSSYIFVTKSEFKEVQCEQPERFILPLDIFLLPLQERGPPPGKVNSHFLSFHSWQSFYSIFII